MGMCSTGQTSLPSVLVWCWGWFGFGLCWGFFCLFCFFQKKDAMEKAEKTAGLILLPQAGTQTKNNVTAGNTITPV